jgi:hypothetical protein
MPKAILLLFLLLPVLMFAQRDTVMLRHTLSVAPLRLIDNSNPGVEFGYEYRHHAFRSTRLIVAYMTPAFSNMDRWSEFRGFRLGVEELFHTRSLPRGHYIGTGLVFNNVHFRRSGFYAIDTDENTKHDTVRLDRTTIALNLFYCNQFAAGRFLFDFSSGIGLKIPDSKTRQARLAHELCARYRCIHQPVHGGTELGHQPTFFLSFRVPVLATAALTASTSFSKAHALFSR